MIELNLTANDTQERKVLAYLQENASDVLADKINNGTPFEKDGHPLANKKTLSGFMKYACSEAQKLAEKGARSACVDDEIVYGWAIHYFEEDSIEGTLYTLDGEEYKPIQKTVNKPVTKPTTKVKAEPPKPQNFQFSIFDNLSETDVKEPITDTLTTETDTNEEIIEEVTPVKEEPKIAKFYTDYKLYQSERPTAIVALRLGDFYEVFGDDAVKLGDELSLTITSRDVGLENRIPMIGFPYHAAENYFAKIAKNHDLYIVENERDTQFIPRVNYANNGPIDEDTGEIFDLSEEEMREFDGDISEAVDIDTLEDLSDDPVISQLVNIFGNALEVK